MEIGGKAQLQMRGTGIVHRLLLGGVPAVIVN
jgi:hypothetical protein